jgi:hypothetical protein
MANELIKLENNLYLYSGDIITINNSSPLLIEIITDQTVKLRNVKDDNYLSKNSKILKKFLGKSNLLKFSTNFDNALIFTVKKNDNSKISLQENDKYLELDNKNFHLSSEEK